MKTKWVAAAILIAIALSGCATTEPIWFIATPGFVEAQIATSENATKLAYENQIAQLQGEINAQRAVSEELGGLVDVISEIEDSNRQLLGLADELEDRLSSLPQETIRQLVDILENYLEEGLPQ